MIGTSLAQTSIQSTWLQKIQRVAEQLLNGVAVFVVPILIGGTIAVVLFWHGGKPEPLEGIPLPMRVWENTVSSASLGRGAVLANLLATSPTNRMETRLSTDQVVTWGDDAQSFATVEATVTDSLLLHDWIRSKGASVQVLAPADLIQKIQHSLASQ